MTKVLLVEDNELNAPMFARKLRSKGFEVIAVKDGEEAVALTKSEKPDVVLMDRELIGSKIDGVEATEQIHQFPETSHIPIIALTALVMYEEQEAFIRAGAKAVEEKPVQDWDRLVQRMETLIKESKN